MPAAAQTAAHLLKTPFCKAAHGISPPTTTRATFRRIAAGAFFPTSAFWYSSPFSLRATRILRVSTQTHANQGLVLFLFYACYSVLTRIITNILNLTLGFIPFVPGMISAALQFIGIIFFVLMILGIANAASGKVKELPFIGRIRLLK